MQQAGAVWEGEGDQKEVSGPGRLQPYSTRQNILMQCNETSTQCLSLLHRNLLPKVISGVHCNAVQCKGVH